MKNNDTRLIRLTLEGDDSAFAELVEKYQKQ
ncbi:RNA polymerase sigma factor SigW, partial [Candidatus Poribacteria bacterium]|nr:RNA polymerase sigma factor SigW [Candidatus Poribacteria bacterium]